MMAKLITALIVVLALVTERAHSSEDADRLCEDVFDQVMQALNDTVDPLLVPYSSIANLMGRSDIITVQDAVLRGLTKYKVRPGCGYQSVNVAGDDYVKLSTNVAFMEVAFNFRLQAQVALFTTPPIEFQGTMKYATANFVLLVHEGTHAIKLEGLKVQETYGIKVDHSGSWFPLRPALTLIDSIATKFTGSLIRHLMGRSLDPAIHERVDGIVIKHFQPIN